MYCALMYVLPAVWVNCLLRKFTPKQFSLADYLFPDNSSQLNSRLVPTNLRTCQIHVPRSLPTKIVQYNLALYVERTPPPPNNSFSRRLVAPRPNLTPVRSCKSVGMPKLCLNIRSVNQRRLPSTIMLHSVIGVHCKSNALAP